MSCLFFSSSPVKKGQAGSVIDILESDSRVVSIQPSDNYFSEKEKFYEHLDNDAYLSEVKPFENFTGNIPLKNQPKNTQRHFLSWALSREYQVMKKDRENVKIPPCINSNWDIPFDKQEKTIYGGGSGDKCGMGKTYEMLSLIACNTPSVPPELLSDVLNNATLFVAPANVIETTVKKELHKQVGDGIFDVIFYIGSDRHKKLDIIRQHYAQTCDSVNTNQQMLKKKMKERWPKSPVKNQKRFFMIEEGIETKNPNKRKISPVIREDFNFNKYGNSEISGKNVNYTDKKRIKTGDKRIEPRISSHCNTRETIGNGRLPLVVFTSYETLNIEIKKLSKGGEISKEKKTSIFDIIKVWWRIVLDESHNIRNIKTGIYQSVNKLTGINKWCMSGTLFVNRPDDLFAMFKFLGLFNTVSEWQEKVVNQQKQLDKLMGIYTMSRDSKKYLKCEKEEIYVQVKMSPIQYWLYYICYEGSRKEFFLIRKHMKRIPKCHGRRNILRRLRMRIDHQILRLMQIAADPYAAFCSIEKSSELKRLYSIGLSQGFSGGYENSDNETGKFLSQCEDIGYSNKYVCNTCLTESATLQYVTDPCRHWLCELCVDDLLQISGNGNTEIVSLDSIYQTTMQCFCKSQIQFFIKHGGNGSYKIYIRDIIKKKLDEKTKNVVLGSDIRNDKDNKILLKENKEKIDNLREYQCIAEMTDEQIQKNIFDPRPVLTNLYDTSSKTNVLMDCLEKLEPSKKVVVACKWTSQLRIIELKMKERRIPYLKIEGSVTKSKRRKLLDQFEESTPIGKNDGQCRVLLIQSQTCGTGMNITTASVMFLMNKEFNVATEQQLQSRIHRMNQKASKIEVIHLMSHHSIEKRIQKLQRRKDRIKKMVMPFSHTEENEDVDMCCSQSQSNDSSDRIYTGRPSDIIIDWDVKNSCLLKHPNPLFHTQSSKCTTVNEDDSEIDDEDVVQYQQHETNYSTSSILPETPENEQNMDSSQSLCKRNAWISLDTFLSFKG